jgi:ZIP family zinc transporter
MSNLWTVLLLSLLPGAGNFLGAMAAEVQKPSPRFLNWALHAASGIVIAIVAVELMPSALGKLAGWWVALAFALGGMAYIVLEAVVERLQSGKAGSDRSRMWMIYAAVALDLTSDGLMIGTGAAVSLNLALIMAAGQVLADVPEGYATVANFRDKGVPRAKRLLFTGSFFIYVVGSAMASYFLLRNATEQMKMAALVFVAGLLTVAAVEDMLEEAHVAHSDSRRSVLAFIGGFTLFTLVSAGLGVVVGR